MLGAFISNSWSRLEEPRYEGDHSADKRDRAEQEYTAIFFSRSHAMKTPHCGVRSNELYGSRKRGGGKVMRIVVVGLLIAVTPLQAFAEASKKTAATKQSMKPAPRKPDPCKQYGAGFVQVEGTSTCIRVGGSVGIGGGISQ
jgi:hypothetical protein